MAVISAVSNIVAGNKATKAQVSAANRSADISAEQAEADRELQWRMYQQQRGDYDKYYNLGRGDLTQGYANAQTVLDPYDDYGPAATQRLAELSGVSGPGAQLAALGNDPGYQFRLQQGVRAQDMSAAARGRLLSGAQQKGLQEFSQGLASSELGNAYNRVAGVADAGRNISVNRANLFTGQGTALANLATGQASNLNNLATNTTNAVTNIGQANAQNQMQAQEAIGQARASGYQNTGKAIGTAMNTGTNMLMKLAGF